MDDVLIPVLAILFIFGMPAIIGGLIFSGWLVHNTRRHRERTEARKLYERIVQEKLDVMRTALAMGRGDDELRELDQRLQRLIGAEQMKSLLDTADPRPPEVSAELADADLEAELKRLEQGPAREGER